MDVFEDQSYKLNVIFLCLVGQWPYQDTKTKCFRRIIIAIVMMISLNCQFIKFLRLGVGIDVSVDMLPIIGVTVIAFVNHMNCWIQDNGMKGILERIRYDRCLLNAKEETQILQVENEKAKFYGICFFILGVLTMCMYFAMPLTPYILDIVMPLNESRPRIHPFKLEYFVDPQKYYYPILVHMIVTSVIVVVSLVATDWMLLMILVHAAAVLRIIGIKFERIYDDFQGNYGTETYRLFYAKLTETVHCHRKLLEYVESIQSCFGIACLLQLVFVILILTILLLKLYSCIQMSEDIGSTLTCGIFVFGTLCVVLLNIYPAQKVTDFNEENNYKLYGSRWYVAPPKAQKMMMLLAPKCMKPCRLTALYLFSMTFEMYATVVQTSLSYFTVLCSVQQ